MEKYTEDVAATEAQNLRELIELGVAVDYDDAERIIDKKTIFTKEDILKMTRNGLALRHVSTLSEALNEKSIGIIDGDAVSLRASASFFEEEPIKRIGEAKGYDKRMPDWYEVYPMSAINDFDESKQ